MTNVIFENRIFLFIDILGFGNLIRSERRDEIADILYANYDGNARLRTREQMERGTKFECSAFSDSLIASDLAQPDSEFKVIEYGLYLQNKFLWRGIFLRGGIVIDEIHHSPNVVVGEAIIRAADLEKKAHYPRILVSDEVAASHFFRCEEIESALLREREKFKIIRDQLDDFVINPFYYDPDEPQFVREGGRRRDVTLTPLMDILKGAIREPRNRGHEQRLEYVLALGDLVKSNQYFDGQIESVVDFTADGPVARFHEFLNMAEISGEEKI